MRAHIGVLGGRVQSGNRCSVVIISLSQNHRGALIQFGEGLHKLRRQRLRYGGLHEFEQDMSALLEFVYNTQLEHAACDDDACVPMAGDDESYRSGTLSTSFSRCSEFCHSVMMNCWPERCLYFLCPAVE
jgi:hypothetical protein